MKTLARLLIALALICWPASACAQLTLTGVGPGGFGTPVNFSASTGVLFDKDVTISTAAQVATGTASITTTVMTVTVATGTPPFVVGMTLSGTGVAAGTTITSLGTGTGGTGTYNISPSQTVVSETITGTKAYVATPLGGVTNTAEATVAFWALGSTVQTGSTSLNMLNSAVFSTGGTSAGCEPSTGGIGWCSVPSDNSAVGTQFSFSDSTGSGSAHGINLAATTPAFVNGVWNFFIATYKQNHCNLYHAVLGGSATSIGTCPANITSAITNDLANANGAFMFNGLAGGVSFGYIQDFYASQTYYGCTGAGTPVADCAADNTISPSQLAKFISSGKAVDLGPTCSKPAAQPALCLTGDATGMVTNKGFATGLSLNHNGGVTLAADATIDNAPYSAGVGIIPHEVTLRGAPYANPNAAQTLVGGGTCGASSTCTFGASSNGAVQLPSSGLQPICTGVGTGINGATGCTGADLRVLIVTLQASVTQHNPAAVCPTTDSVAWTLVQDPTNKFDTLEGMASFLCYKIATSGETDTAPGATWFGQMIPAWTMLTYANVASVQQAAGLTSSTAQTSLVTATSGTLPAVASKLVSIWTAAEGSSNARLYTYTGTGIRRLRGSDYLQTPTYIVDEDVAASAAIQRTLTRNVVTHGTSINFYLSLVPN